MGNRLEKDHIYYIYRDSGHLWVIVVEGKGWEWEPHKYLMHRHVKTALEKWGRGLKFMWGSDSIKIRKIETPALMPLTPS